jgi:hypothetical protein
MNFTRIASLAAAAALLWTPPAFALTITDQGFDQIAKINALGGTVTQIGGVNAGGTLLTAADFCGSVATCGATVNTGLSVSGTSFHFVTQVLNFNDGGSTEPGNLASALAGSATDATFTLPGPGGPDGTNGDGSIQFLQGGSALLEFGQDIFAGFGVTEDLFFFTNTASGGDAFIELLDNSVVVESITATLPDGAEGSGFGGLTLDVTDGLIFDAIQLTASLNGLPVEIDAVAALPEPSLLGLLATGLFGLAALRRRSA